MTDKSIDKSDTYDTERAFHVKSVMIYIIIDQDTLSSALYWFNRGRQVNEPT